MKKWFRFFCLSFFSDKISKEGARRGYTNFFISLILALAFLWVGFVGSEMLPFSAHYNNASDFVETARGVLASADVNDRITIEIQEGLLKAKKHGGEYAESLLVNTWENESDKQNYSVNGYNVVVDTRSSDTLAEIEAYCISNDGKDLIISYEEYLTLSAVARLNFDFKLTYTGRELELDDESVASYLAYLESTGEENKLELEGLADDLSENKITKSEYNRKIYELYFTNYYPAITDYESSSKVPLLRNYYYHQYIKDGISKYLLIFDDYMMGSFETERGIDVSFYGFYSGLDEGVVISEGAAQSEAEEKADGFIKDSFNAIWLLNVYAYAMNVFSLIPFIALMPMVVTLLAYSLLKLRGVESISSLGAMFKIIGSYVWFSGAISAAITVVIAFFVQRDALIVLPLILFFVTLAIRSIIFSIRETQLYRKQTVQTEE